MERNFFILLNLLFADKRQETMPLIFYKKF